MPTRIGAHSERLALARDLLTKKGRRERRAFSFEGPTLLEEALASSLPLDELYVTQRVYDTVERVRELERRGTPTFVVDDRAFAKISDVETPSGLLAVAPLQIDPLEGLLTEPGVVLALAGVSDPGNAGTLLRSAEAFGVDRVIFGEGGVEPHHPKVVRAAMGALFRIRVAVGTAAETADLAHARGWLIGGLAADGEPVEAAQVVERLLLVVGQERHGLGDWERACDRRLAIAMRGRAESLNAAAAGSIALYESMKLREKPSSLRVSRQSDHP